LTMCLLWGISQYMAVKYAVIGALTLLTTFPDLLMTVIVSPTPMAPDI
jgi:hypothetical protein